MIKMMMKLLTFLGLLLFDILCRLKEVFWDNWVLSQFVWKQNSWHFSSRYLLIQLQKLKQFKNWTKLKSLSQEISVIRSIFVSSLEFNCQKAVIFETLSTSDDIFYGKRKHSNTVFHLVLQKRLLLFAIHRHQIFVKVWFFTIRVHVWKNSFFEVAVPDFELLTYDVDR